MRHGAHAYIQIYLTHIWERGRRVYMYTSILWDTVHMYIHICICYTYGREDDVYICIYIYYETRCTCIYTYVLYAYIAERNTSCHVQPVPEKMRLEMVLKMQNGIIWISFLIQECVCVCVYIHTCMYVCIYICVTCETRCVPCLIAFLMIQECTTNATRTLLECTTKSFGFRTRNQETTVLGLFSFENLKREVRSSSHLLRNGL